MTKEKAPILTIEGIIQHLKERRNIEKELQEYEKYSKLISENANDLISIFNKEFEYEYVNEPIHEKVLGYKKEDLIGRSMFNIIHPQDQLKTRNFFKDLNFSNGAPIEQRIKNFKEEYIWIESKGNLVIEEDGQNKILLISRDITERKKIEQNLVESEEKYRVITENANDLICVVNHQFKYEYINQAYKRILGYTSEDLIGQRAVKFIHPDDIERVVKKVKETYKKEFRTQVFRTRHKDGSYRWLAIKSNDIFDGDGLTKTIVISRDITEQIKLENELKESEEKYKNLVKYSPNSIILLDFNGNIIDCNKITERILNLEKDKIIGKNLLHFNLSKSGSKSNNLRETLLKILKKIQNGTLNKPIELQYINNKNERIWLNNLCSIVKIGGKDYVQVVSEDITELKQAEIIIQEENERLKKIDELRVNFINRASHELKTPVTSIYGASQMIIKIYEELLSKYDFLFSSSYKEFLEMIESSSKRLKDLAENLLNLSQIDSGILNLNKKKVNISNLILECINMLSIQAKSRNIRINYNKSENIEVLIDESQIFRVFQNTISNAINNTPPDGEIFVNIERKNNFINISIKDTGIGLNTKELEKIFTKFGKIERSGSDLINEGLGFGLYFSKEIVKLHKGKIWAESEGRNKGSTFFIKLPI